MEKMSFYEALFDLKDKTAVVVGGTGVLCGAMARGLWQAGCNVMLVGRNREKAENHFRLWQADHQRTDFYKANVNQREELEGIITKGIERFGGVDIWINGAGVNSATPYLDVDDDELEELLSTNFKSVHWGCQVIGKYWLEKKQKGSIINLSSMAAVRPLSRVFIYSAAKAALLNLTQNLAREWASNGIRVNAICPGFFPAEQNRKILDPVRKETILKQTPMARFGEAEELIGAALLLASEKAGSFITGINLVVDGGFSINSI